MGLIHRLLRIESRTGMQVNLAAVLFPEAARVWLESRKLYLSPSTLPDYSIYIKTLTAYFSELRLHEIDGDQIRAYQRARQARVGPGAINKECSVLQQMLKRVGRWPEIAHDYQPLPLPRGSRGRALSDAEYGRLFRAATGSPGWRAAYLFAVISANTSAGPKEVRTLRLQDVDLVERTISVEEGGAKNVYRIRVVPLNEMAFAAATEAVKRARELGSTQPEHYLFPFLLRHRDYDPARCQTSFKRAWKEITTVAELPGLRMYDLRHHCITALLQNPKISEETVTAIAGHVSKAMLRKYSHIRLEYKRRALDSLTPFIKKLPRSVDDGGKGERNRAKSV